MSLLLSCWLREAMKATQAAHSRRSSLLSLQLSLSAPHQPLLGQLHLACPRGGSGGTGLGRPGCWQLRLELR